MDGGAQTTQLYNFIFLTQMPLFIFIAGFFVSKKFNEIKTIKDYGFAVGKAAISLLVPFASYSLITKAFNTLTINDYLNKLLNCILEPQTSLWFLWALFWLEFFILTSFFFANLFKNNNSYFRLIVSFAFFAVFIGVLTVLFLKVTNYFDLKLIVYYSIYFIFGATCFSLKETKLLGCRKIAWCRIVFTLICLAILIAVMLSHPTIIDDKETLFNIATRVAGSSASICVCYFAFYYIKNQTNG